MIPFSLDREESLFSFNSHPNGTFRNGREIPLRDTGRFEYFRFEFPFTKNLRSISCAIFLIVEFRM